MEEEDIDIAGDVGGGDTSVNSGIQFRRRDSTVIPDQMDNRLIEIVERMLNYCFVTGQYKNAIGIACECRRLDFVEKAIRQSGMFFLYLILCLVCKWKSSSMNLQIIFIPILCLFVIQMILKGHCCTHLRFVNQIK